MDTPMPAQRKVIDGKKQCLGCGQWLDVKEHFKKDLRGNPKPRCIPCEREAHNERQNKARNPPPPQQQTGTNPFEWRTYKQPCTTTQTDNPYDPYQPLGIERE